MDHAIPAAHRSVTAPRVIDGLGVQLLCFGTLLLRPVQSGWRVLFTRSGLVRLGDDRQLLDGECVVLGSAPQRVRVEGEALHLVIPAALAGGSGSGLQAMTGRVLRVRSSDAGLAGHVLEGLAELPQDYRPASPGRLAQHVVGLLALLGADSGADASGRESLLHRAKELVEERLGEPELGPDAIARELHVSTRTLQRVFEAAGSGTGAWIRQRRLEHCRMELADPLLRGDTVSAIGTRWGLWDAAHFSRAFKAAYGLSPRAYRAAHLAHRCGESCTGEDRAA